MTESARPNVVPADVTQWSEKSQRSVCVEWVREYEDIHYKCHRCRNDAVFSAADQKYTYEVKKANISQGRSLCGACWAESRRIGKEVADCDARWAASKATLRNDAAFLNGWLELVTLAAKYSWGDDTAKKRMIEKLLARIL